MISTKGRYAVRVMLDLAEQIKKGNEGYVPLKDIAERQDISKKYLEIIVKDMVSGGLLVGASGKGGGYKLCRKPEEYTVGEILELMGKEDIRLIVNRINKKLFDIMENEERRGE